MGNPFETIDSRLTVIEGLLLDIKHQRIESTSENQAMDDDDLLNVKQASAFLKLAIPTIYSLVSTRKISSYKRGKKLYFKKSELTDWIQSGKRSSTSEIAAKARQRTAA